MKLQLRIRKEIFIAVLLSALFCFAACKNNDYDYVDVSKETRQAFDAMYPGATGIRWEVESGFYVVEYILDGHSCESWYRSNADWMQTFKTIPTSALPEEVKAGCQKSKYGTWQIEEAKIVIKPNEPNTYMIDCIDNIEVSLLFSAEGELLMVYE